MLQFVSQSRSRRRTSPGPEATSDGTGKCMDTSALLSYQKMGSGLHMLMTRIRPSK